MPSPYRCKMADLKKIVLGRFAFFGLFCFVFSALPVLTCSISWVFSMELVNSKIFNQDNTGHHYRIDTVSILND